MTNRLRSSVCNIPALGVENNLDIILVVEWWWLALPTSLVTVTIGFLATVMVQSYVHKVELWKTSFLALLFHGLDGVVRRECGMSEVQDLKEMGDVAGRVVVKLRRQDGGMGMGMGNQGFFFRRRGEKGR